MGNYTVYAQMGASSWYSRRSRGHGSHKAAPNADGQPREVLRMQCPRCEQTFPFDGTCPTCEVQLVDRNEVLVVPKNVESTRPLVVGSPYAFAIGAAATLLPAVYLIHQELEHSAANVSTWALIATVAAAGLGGALYLIRGARRSRAHKRWIAGRRSHAAATTVSTTAVLPSEAEVPVRVRGRLRLAVEGEEMRAWIEDDEGIARLPVSTNLRVASADALEEVEELAAGRVVEVVGLGRRVAKSGEGYRNAEHDFVFDEGSVVDVWV